MATTKLKCPECGDKSKTFQTPAALGSHRLIMHKVAGTSAGSAARRGKKKTKRKYTKRAKAAPAVVDMSLTGAIDLLQHEVEITNRIIARLRSML